MIHMNHKSTRHMTDIIFVRLYRM